MGSPIRAADVLGNEATFEPVKRALEGVEGQACPRLFGRRSGTRPECSTRRASEYYPISIVACLAGGGTVPQAITGKGPPHSARSSLPIPKAESCA